MLVFVLPRKLSFDVQVFGLGFSWQEARGRSHRHPCPTVLIGRALGDHVTSGGKRNQLIGPGLGFVAIRRVNILELRLNLDGLPHHDRVRSGQQLFEERTFVGLAGR